MNRRNTSADGKSPGRERWDSSKGLGCAMAVSLVMMVVIVLLIRML